MGWPCTLVAFMRRARGTGLPMSAPALKMSMPRPIPAGVVMATRQASVGFSTVINLDKCFSCGEMYAASELSMGSSSEVEACEGELDEEEREAIRIPRERPSKSWWKIIAIRRDAVKR